MTTLAPQPLSGSTNGRMIKVTGTGTGASVTLHTAQSGTGTADYVELYAQNSQSAAVLLTIEWGGTSSPDDLIQVTVPGLSGLVPVTPPLPLRNSLVIKAWAGTANVVMVTGKVMREA